MKKLAKGKTVLVTGAGGPAIAGMVSALREWGYRIVAVDMLAHSPGFYLSDKSYVVPPGGDPNFLNVLKKICTVESVDAIISVVDEELKHVIKLEEIGIAVIQPRLSFVNLCLDKYVCMQELRKAGISAPNTWLLNDLPSDVNYPLFIKPRIGRGSRGCSKVESQEELKLFIQTCGYCRDDLIAQSYLEGKEFTVSVVVWRDGKVHAVVPKEIISKVGITKLAVTRYNKKIISLCTKIQKSFSADGPFNVQLALDMKGDPYVFEINPRFSTSITLTQASGVDEMGGILAKAILGLDSYKFGEWKDGIVMVRHTMDQFITEAAFNIYE